MFQILYYPSNGYCQIQKGFPTREAAYNWIKDQLNEIDYYRIDPEF